MCYEMERNAKKMLQTIEQMYYIKNSLKNTVSGVVVKEYFEGEVRRNK